MSYTTSELLKCLLSLCTAIVLFGCAPAVTPLPPTAMQPAPTQPAPTQPPATAQQPAGQIANPASENCIKHGGTLSIQTRGDGGQYGSG